MTKTSTKPAAGVLEAAKTIADLAAFNGAPDDATIAVTLGELRALARALAAADGPSPARGGDLKAWRDRHGFRSLAAASRAVGCHRNAWAIWEADGSVALPRYISLACSAVAYGLPGPVVIDEPEAAQD